MLVRELAAVMQEYTQRGGVRPFGISLLLAGFDHNGPQLFQIDPSGSYFAWKASASARRPPAVPPYSGACGCVHVRVCARVRACARVRVCARAAFLRLAGAPRSSRPPPLIPPAPRSPPSWRSPPSAQPAPPAFRSSRPPAGRP